MLGRSRSKLFEHTNAKIGSFKSLDSKVSRRLEIILYIDRAPLGTSVFPKKRDSWMPRSSKISILLESLYRDFRIQGFILLDALNFLFLILKLLDLATVVLLESIDGSVCTNLILQGMVLRRNRDDYGSNFARRDEHDSCPRERGKCPKVRGVLYALVFFRCSTAIDCVKLERRIIKKKKKMRSRTAGFCAGIHRDIYVSKEKKAASYKIKCIDKIILGARRECRVTMMLLLLYETNNNTRLIIINDYN